MNYKYIIFILLSLVLLVFSACEINQLNSAEDHYKNKRYAAAIQELDNYIQTGKNGALITRGEILRSQCYYELGLRAIELENWDLSIKFLKLANSEEADKVLADVYKKLADKALEEGELELSFNLVNTILREIPHSELTAEMLSRRISFLLDTFKIMSKLGKII
jgi:tetratricopeptide (TPR) repeat protein